MKPLAEIVAEIEATIKNKRDAYEDDAEYLYVGTDLRDMARLCQAFRAAEKMRGNVFFVEHLVPITSPCPGFRIPLLKGDMCYSADEWDRVTGGNDDT